MQNLKKRKEFAEEAKNNSSLWLANRPKYFKLTDKSSMMGVQGSENEKFELDKGTVDYVFKVSYNYTKEKTKDTLKCISSSIRKLNINELKFSDEILGEAAQGKVYKGSLYGTPIAIQQIKKCSEVSQLLLTREIFIMEKIRHPNFINIMGYCSKLDTYYIAIEYFQGYSLG